MDVEGGGYTAASNVPAFVHTLLERKQTRTDPKAVAAVRGEVEALSEAGTWDEDNVIEKDVLLERAKHNKQKVYVGEGSGICSIKNSELPETDEHRKYKARFVYRTPTARDEQGALALFQEMASRPCP